MDFRLTDEQILLQQSIQRFVEDNVIPNARAWDAEHRFPHEVVRGLGELGVLGVQISENYGGTGLGSSELALIVDELAQGDGSLALTVASHNGLCGGHVRLAGNDDQKQRFLPKLATGEQLGAWALTEPGSGSDAAGMRTTAVRDEARGQWRINGSKIFITQGSVAQVYVVLAVTDASKGNHGVSAFVVDASAKGGAKGLRAQPMKHKLGMRSSDTAELFFDDVQAELLGEENHGFIDTLKILDRGRITIAALACGLASGALSAARRYAKERQQFGKAIAEFQAIQFKLADMATELDAARLLTRRAAWLADTGQPFAKEASIAKLFASEAAMRITDHGIQIHGGYGFTTEFPVERYYRDAKLTTIGEGTSEVQRLVIARALLTAAA